MELTLSNGDKLFFCWSGCGELRIDVVAPPAVDAQWNDGKTMWPVVGSASLTGEDLVNFLENFTRPLFRRALAVAVKYPSK